MAMGPWVAALLSGCIDDQKLIEEQEIPLTKVTSAQEAVWAVNIGGPGHTGIDGVEYQADDLISHGQLGRADNVLGSQTGFIYQTYRSGISEIKQSIANGVYDITFKFSEPLDVGIGERVFSLFVEGKKRIADLDVLSQSAGQKLTALDRTVTHVEIFDQQLDIRFEGRAGLPIINALVVRQKSSIQKRWALVWNDEFNNQKNLDASKWNIDMWPAAKVNEEDQAYTEREKNVRVKDGKLVLEAHRENYRNAAYTSGRIHSQGKGDFLYGRVEVRAKLPAGQGTWSAIWMLPGDPFKYATRCGRNEDWQGSPTCDAWPNSGEIDLMEHVGYDMNRIHGTVHNKSYYWVNGKQRKGSVEGEDVSEAFHVYSLEWTSDRIDIFFDDSLYFSYFKESEAWQSWPYNHPYHVILNLAIGGNWGRAGGAIDDGIFPVRMEVDYVRIYSPLQPRAEVSPHQQEQ